MTLLMSWGWFFCKNGRSLCSKSSSFLLVDSDTFFFSSIKVVSILTTGRIMKAIEILENSSANIKAAYGYG